MTDNLTTKPTLDTLMDMMRELRDGMAKFEERLNVRLDRIEAEVKITHSELYTLRADFTELRAQLREHLPALK